MADYSNLKIDEANTFDEWLDKYNQIPDLLSGADDTTAAINQTIQDNAVKSEKDAIKYAIALG